MKRTALIFGISGQDGTYLAKFLLSKGYKVHGTTRSLKSSPISNLKNIGILKQVVLHNLSILDFKSTIQLINKIMPHEIYNLSGQTSVALSFAHPVETQESIMQATKNILEAIRKSQMHIKLFNASSSECFGNTKGLPANETTPHNPINPYAIAKYSAFKCVCEYRERYRLFATSGLLFNHESPLRTDYFVTKKIALAAAKIALGSKECLNLGDLSIQRDWGWAPEFVIAMWQILQQKKPKDYVIATGHLSSLQDFVANAFQAVNLDWEQHVISDSSLIRPNEVKSIYGNPEKANKDLDWKASIFAAEIAHRMTKYEFERLSA